MDRLRVIPPHGKSFVHDIEGDSLVVGRSSEADIRIADRFLSRRHARLFRKDDAWWIEDLGSRNGSWVNGRRIDRPTRFESDDRLRVSNSHIRLGSEPLEIDRTPTDFISDESDVVYLPAAELAAVRESHELADVDSPDALRHQAEHLRMLNAIHSALSEPVDLETLLEMILDRAFDALRPDQGVIYLTQPNGDYHRAAERSISALANEHLDSETLLARVASQGLAARVERFDVDPDWKEAISMHDQGIRSLVAAPLMDSQGSLGMIALTSQAVECPFDEQALQLLVSLASVAALRIRNLSLAEERSRKAAELESIQKDLELARQIQLELLPTELPTLKGYELFGTSLPSRQVSGDYYQIVLRSEGEEAVVVLADVVGKGLGAALLTASLEALAAGPIDVGRPPAEVCKRVNRRLHARTPSGKFATAFIGALRADGDQLRFASAGHSPGLLMRPTGEIHRLLPTGPPIGLFPASDYQESTCQIAVGDLLVLYTDGITEAVDFEGREYGLERLMRVCNRRRDAALGEVAKAVERDMQEFVRGVPYDDDRTLVLLRRS